MNDLAPDASAPTIAVLPLACSSLLFFERGDETRGNARHALRPRICRGQQRGTVLGKDFIESDQVTDGRRLDQPLAPAAR